MAQLDVPVPVLPVVDDHGTAWFLSARPDDNGSYLVTAADPDGWVRTSTFQVGGSPNTESTLIMAPSGSGVLASATRCRGDGCVDSDLVVARYERRANDIATVGTPWETPRDRRSSGAAPRPVATTGGVAVLQDSYQLLEFREGMSPDRATLPDNAGDPCLTADGLIVAVEVRPGRSDTGGTGQPTVVTPSQQTADNAVLRLLYLDDQEWSTAAGSERSWASTYRTGAAFHCGAEGPYYALASQAAELAWSDGWNEIRPVEVTWDLYARSTARGPLGVRDGSLTLLDPISSTAASLADVPLPTSVSAALDEAVAASSGQREDPVSGWLAIGGSKSTTGVVCLRAANEHENEVTCYVFS